MQEVAIIKELAEKAQAEWCKTQDKGAVERIAILKEKGEWSIYRCGNKVGAGLIVLKHKGDVVCSIFPDSSNIDRVVEFAGREAVKKKNAIYTFLKYHMELCGTFEALIYKKFIEELV